jgi:hypothetical protein
VGEKQISPFYQPLDHAAWDAQLFSGVFRNQDTPINLNLLAFDPDRRKLARIFEKL